MGKKVVDLGSSKDLLAALPDGALIGVGYYNSTGGAPQNAPSGYGDFVRFKNSKGEWAIACSHLNNAFYAAIKWTDGWTSWREL